jgi:hypothetical protein
MSHICPEPAKGFPTGQILAENPLGHLSCITIMLNSSSEYDAEKLHSASFIEIPDTIL